MAAQNYPITFVNGVAEKITLPVGTYSYVSNTLAGYEGGSVAQFTVTPTTTEVILQVSAAGTLTVTVKDDLDDPITEGKLQLSSSDGQVRYGDEVDISNGTVTFANVPYTASGIATHIAQNGSDANHKPITTPQAVSITAKEQTAAVENERKSFEVTPSAVDANYAGLTPLNGDVVVNG